MAAKRKKETVAKKTTSVAPKPSRRLELKTSNVKIFLAVLIIGGLAYLGKSLFVAAIVNGRPVSRMQIVREAEKQAGAQILDDTVTRILIEQEAQKTGVSATDEEIDQNLATIEERIKGQGQTLEQVMAAQGLTMKEVRSQIKLQVLVEKMLSDQVNITDEDVASYLAENGELMGDGTGEEKAALAKEQLRQQALSIKFQDLLTKLKTEANIRHFVNY